MAAALTAATSNTSAQGIIKIFAFAESEDGDTFNGPPNPKGFWLMTHHSTTNANSVTESAGVYTFQLGATSATTLFVIV